MSKSCQKLVKNFVRLGKKPIENNGAIVEKVRWCNSKKVNWWNNNNKNKKKIIGIPSTR
jgi:hypothetical protein